MANANCSVFIQGLPLNTTVQSLNAISTGPIAINRYGAPQIQIFPRKDGASYLSAKIIFRTPQTAQDFIRTQDGQPVPGGRNKLTVKLFEEKKSVSNVTLPGRIMNARSTSTGLFRTQDARHVSVGRNQLSVRPFEEKRSASNVPQPGRIMNTRSTSASSQPSRKSQEREGTIDKHSVHIVGLPETATEDSVYKYFNSKIGEIGRYPLGKNMVHLLKQENGKSIYKITFESREAARRCIAMTGQTFNGRYVLKIRPFIEQKVAPLPLSQPLVINKHSDKPKTIVRNVIYIQGLPKNVDEGDVINAIEVIGVKVMRVRLYKYEDGKSQGRGIVSLENPAAAKKCIDLLTNTSFPGMEIEMVIGLFESTKIRRLPNAQGNDHLFRSTTPGYAYDCVACFETWDERDMIGCVPVGHDQVDMETHFMCQECVKGHAKALTFDGKVGTGGAGLPCGTPDCRRVLLRAPVERLLDTETEKLLDKRLTSEALRGVEGIEYCKSCDFGAFLVQDTIQMQYFVCYNQQCGAQFCRICLIDLERHLGKECDEVDPARAQDKARKQLEERATANFVRICPQCKSQFVKETGCNKMTCSCGLTMCYLCRETGISYAHFNNGRCTSQEDSNLYDAKGLERIRNEARMNELTRAMADHL